MTVQGILDVLEVLTVTYPNYHPEAEKVLKVWGSVLKGYDDEQVKKAVEAYIVSDTSGFAPTPGQIVGMVRSISEPEGMTETQAWSYVYKALSNSLYGYKEEFEKLPDNVKRVVGNPEQLREWATMDLKDVSSVVSSNFMRSYRAAEKERKDMWALRKQGMITEDEKKMITG